MGIDFSLRGFTDSIMGLLIQIADSKSGINFSNKEYTMEAKEARAMAENVNCKSCRCFEVIEKYAKIGHFRCNYIPSNSIDDPQDCLDSIELDNLVNKLKRLGYYVSYLPTFRGILIDWSGNPMRE